MAETVAPEAFERSEELRLPVDTFLRELEELACRWGGRDYQRGYVDGVYMMRGVRLCGEDSMSMVRFDADRIREAPYADDYYTAYTLNITITRDIDELPQHAYNAALNVFEPEELADQTLPKEEKHVLVYTVRDDLKDLQQEIEISYIVDGDEVYSLSTADTEYGQGGEDEDDDWGEGGSGAVALQPMSGEEYEALQVAADTSSETQLLNDAWMLIAAAKGQLANDELEFDPAMLRAMAKAERRLQKEETRLWRLFSMARCELQEMQIQHCRQVLKKLKPGAAL